jgi:hypothetical protein
MRVGLYVAGKVAPLQANFQEKLRCGGIFKLSMFDPIISNAPIVGRNLDAGIK